MERIKVVTQAWKPGKQVWVYRKPDSQWTILQCLDDSGRNFTAKGVIEFEPRHGDILTLEGQWKQSEFNGQMEFCFKTAALCLPTDPRALLHYACTLTKGLGPVRELEIWEKYGERWQDCETLDLPGLSETVVWNWQETRRRLESQAAQTGAIAWLMSMGCSLNLATLAWNIWELKTHRLVEEDCYRLAELPHYGFSDIDTGIRERFGIADADPRRIQAAILYALDQITSTGNTVAAWSAIFSRVRELLPASGDQFDKAMQSLMRHGKIEMLSGELIATAVDVKHERAVWKRFGAIGQ